MHHGNPEADEKRPPVEWGLIAAEHFGHLMAALRENKTSDIEKEILHVSAVLLELHDSLRKKTT